MHNGPDSAKTGGDGNPVRQRASKEQVVSQAWTVRRADTWQTLEDAPTAPLILRADIDQLDETLEFVTRILKDRGRRTSRVLEVYQRSLADLFAGRRSGAGCSFSVLLAARAELG